MNLLRANTPYLTGLLVMVLTSAFPILASADVDGGTSGGGAFKTPSMIAKENFAAILESKMVENVIGPSWRIRGMEMTGIKPGRIYTYRVTAYYFFRSGSDCLLEVDVVNGKDSTSPPARTSAVRKLSDCKVPPPPASLESVLKLHKDYFDLYKFDFDPEKPYQDYLDLAKQVSADKRRQIREDMATSDESRYHETYSRKAALMAQFMRNRPQTSVGEFYKFLGGEIMELKVDQGIVMPVLIGLEFAPLYIVDAP